MIITRIQPDIAKLVFGFDHKVLAGFAHVLRQHGYATIQYLPTRQSFFALPHEPGNLINAFCHRSHRAFSTSIFPGLYKKVLAFANPALACCLRACFFNEWLERSRLVACFGERLVTRGIENGILRADGNRVQFTASFVPFGDRILLRDPYYVYSSANGTFEGRVWLGADSILFATFLDAFLCGRNFSAALEIGSGSGIQSLVVSRVAHRCLAIDLNERAVQFTQLNARLNAVTNGDARHSNLFESVQGQFDLIFANPWFCDLATGGLEEVPGIIDGLDRAFARAGFASCYTAPLKEWTLSRVSV